MSRIVAISNVAGGTGKTTSAHALAVACAEYGKRVLLLDLDVATALTFQLGLENERTTLAHYLQGAPLSESQILTVSERFDFIASDSRISSLIDIGTVKHFCETLPKDYDLILLDTPSTLDPRLLMAIESAEIVVIPISASLHSIRGANQVRKLATKNSIFGIKIQINSDSNMWDETFEYLDASIPYSDLVDSSLMNSTSVITQNNRSEIAAAYREAAYSLLEKMELI